MPLRLDIKKKLHARTERVKAVCFHPTLPWILSALYNGHLIIYDYEEQSSVRDIEASPHAAIRCATFVERKQWIVCGSDDMAVRIFHYHSLEKVHQFDAHSDFIRHLCAHPTLPLLLTCSDDMTVRLWDWGRDWAKVASFEAHLHYVMMAQWNPKDPHIFASASLDRSIKIWGATTTATNTQTAVTITQPHFSLLGHESGVNAIQYAPAGEKPYIVSAGDDATVRVWDYQTKQCVTVLSGHQGPVLTCCFHPTLPLIVSGGEDSTVVLWHAVTTRREMVLKYSMGRVWSLATAANSSAVAIGTDEGTVVAQLGNDRPVVSMHGGKVVIARALSVQTANLKLIDDSLYNDGERMAVATRELGACEVFAQHIAHHPNGRLVAVCGDGEYIIYTAQALRNKAYGKALDFCWSSEGDYCTKADTGKVTIYRNFADHGSFFPAFPADSIHSGKLLGLRGPDFICFYDWLTLTLIRKIDVAPTGGVYWNDAGTAVVLACADSFYVLKYDAAAVQAYLGTPAADEGIEAAFQFEREINEKLESGLWLADSFLYTTARLRLQMLTAGVVETVAFLERQAWLIGYTPDNNRLYLIDRDYQFTSYKLHLRLLEYQAAVCRGDTAAATAAFPQIPAHLHNRLARFLEAQGHSELALDVSKDEDHRFQLALSLSRLDVCLSILKEKGSSESVGAQWLLLGDAALEAGAIGLAQACFKQADDLEGSLLIATTVGDGAELGRIAEKAIKDGKFNVAITCLFLLKDVDKCVDVLLDRDRVPEAALFARNYARHRLPEVMKIWREKLTAAGRGKIAAALVEPPLELPA